ncbi:MAG: molybdopterin-binding oxidoreductase, partial [Pedobacter sp.]
MEQPTKKKVKAPLSIEQKIKRRNLISFGVFFTFGGGAVAGWRWLLH